MLSSGQRVRGLCVRRRAVCTRVTYRATHPSFSSAPNVMFACNSDFEFLKKID
jgi:hypothetical protein